MNTPLCSAIDTGLFLNTNGDIKTCCAGTDPLGNVRTQALPQIFSNFKTISIKHQLDNGSSPPYCSGCDRLESLSPGSSQRSDFNLRFPSNGKRQIKQIDIRWSNVCNLSCRYCDPVASSSWAKLLDIPVETVNRDYHQSVLDAISDNADTIESAFLLGGEPLLQKQNEQLLQILNPKTQLDIVSNMSVSLENNKIYSLLKGRDNVHWNLSVDNVGDRFEYVRYGANWAQLEHNIRVLKEDFGIHRVFLHPVYGIWSATNLVEYFEFADRHQLNIGWQLANPSYGAYGTDSFSVFDYNQDIKDMALRELERVNSNDPFLAGVKQSLLTTPSKPGMEKQFLDWTRRIESLMPTDKPFKQLWPELYEQMAKTEHP